MIGSFRLIVGMSNRSGDRAHHSSAVGVHVRRLDIHRALAEPTAGWPS